MPVDTRTRSGGARARSCEVATPSLTVQYLPRDRPTWRYFLFLFPILALAAAAPMAAEELLTPDAAVRLALSNNPDLRELAAEIDAAKARVAGASLLLRSNPSLTVTAGPRRSATGRSRDESLSLLQPLEIGGQRRARIDAAQAGLAAAEARLRARRVETATTVRETFGRALAAAQKTRLAGEALTVAQEGVIAAQERFEAGAAALLEVNTARVEAGRMARDRAEAERRSAAALADLHLLLGLAPAELPPLGGELGEATGQTLEEPRLVEEALANRAEIAASRHAVEAAQAQARLAARERIPTPSLGVSVTREEESDAEIVQGLLSFGLPLFDRNQEARGVAAALVHQLEIQAAAVERRVRQEVATAVARLRAARSAADGFASDVVKAMQENMELGTESYRAGKIDFLQLLLIRRQALEARNEHIDVLEELNAARAQLDRAIGSGL